MIVGERFKVKRINKHAGKDREGDTFQIQVSSKGKPVALEGPDYTERKEAERHCQLLNRADVVFHSTNLTVDTMDKFNDISRPTPDRLSEAAKVLGNIKYLGTTSGPLRRDVEIICQLLGIPSVAPNPYVRHEGSTNQEPAAWHAQAVFDELIKLSEHKEKVATALRNLARQISPKE
jgi:hypothetical protein